MVEVIVNDEKLIFGVPRRENYFARTVELPLENITAVEIDSLPAANWLKKFEFLAGFVPAVKKDGTFYEDGNCIYWEVTSAERTIVVSLQNEMHEKLIVEVENPARAVEMIENALKGRNPETEEADKHESFETDEK
jgi:hypothetical protein